MVDCSDSSRFNSDLSLLSIISLLFNSSSDKQSEFTQEVVLYCEKS